MHTETPSHADISKWIREQPLDVLLGLPNCPEAIEAARLIERAAELAHVAREKR